MAFECYFCIMEILQDYKFGSTYELADLIDRHVRAKEGFWNFDIDFFISSATKFSKDTLLHLYIVTTALNYHGRDFRKNGDCYDNESMENWYELFDLFSIKIEKYKFSNCFNLEIYAWFEDNIEKFGELFNRMADEVFYVLFSNRGFLLEFNHLVAKAIREDVIIEDIKLNIPLKHLTKKGTIKRVNIPQ